MTPHATAVEIAPLRYLVGEKAPDAFIPYAASHPAAQSNRQIKRVLFSIHSSGFDALQYFDNARTAAMRVPGVLPKTLIIAPQLFQQSAIAGQIPNHMLFWRVSPFRGSSRAAIGPDVRKVSLSAFEVMDSWLTSLTDRKRFPSLEDIVLVGHSGGGQFVQRYAMVGKFEPLGSVQCRFVVSAPSSYAYPSAERLNRRTNRFAVPDAQTLARCPKYNHWGYGLSAPYAYFSDMDADTIAQRYAERHLFYLCGANDTDPNDRSMGTSCGAMLQGRHRLERMQIFAAFLEHHYGRSVRQTHRFAVIRGVGHHGRGTMTSTEGLRALFAPLR